MGYVADMPNIGPFELIILLLLLGLIVGVVMLVRR